MALWTQSFELVWRPELSFFEARSAILRELESLHLLQAFNSGDDKLAARLDDHSALQIGVGGASLFIGSPKSSISHARMALNAALTLLHPIDVILESMALRYLFPLEMDATTAQRLGAEDVASSMLPRAEPLDWAILIEGRSPNLKSKFLVEYGVVSEGEVEKRLIGTGRLGSPPRILVAPDLGGVPSCAVFFDWRWTIGSKLEDAHVVESLSTAWDSFLSETEAISADVQSRHNLGTLESKKEQG